MIRKLLIFVLLLAAAVAAQAQTTTVTATVTDNSASSTVYILGSYSVTLVNTTSQQPLFGGNANFQQNYSGQSLSSAGVMSIVLPSVTAMQPQPGLQWQFTICANPGQVAAIFPKPVLPCFTYTSTGTQVSGATVDISASLKAVAATIPILSGGGGVGTVTNSLGALTLNDFIFGNGGADLKDAGFSIVPPLNGGTGIANPTVHTTPQAEGAAAFNFVANGLTGQTFTAVNGADSAYKSPGIADGNGGAPVTTTPYVIQCDSGTTLLDRLTTIRFQSGASVITGPDHTASGCSSNMSFALINDGAGTLTVNRSGTDTFTVVDGSTNTDGATSFTFGTGQFVMLNNGAGGIWEARKTTGGAGITLQTNGSNNTSQTTLNFITSATNTIGGIITPSNSTSTEKFELTGTILPIGGGTGISSPTAHSLLMAEGASTFVLVTSPSTNGTYMCGFAVSASAPVDLTCTFPGVPVDATNPATLLYSDRANYLNWTAGTALALPAVAGNFAANFPFVIKNTSTTLTITPNAGASDLIDGAATGTLIPNFAAFVYQDSTTAPGHWFTVKLPTFAAFGSNCGDATHGLSWSTTTGIGCQSITGSAAAGGSNTQIQYNNSTALGGITNFTSNGTNPLLTAIAAPATPASGFDVLYEDSTDLRFHDKNASGTIGTTVVANTGSANNFVTAISTAGVVSLAQPAFSNLSGTATKGQLPASAVYTDQTNVYGAFLQDFTAGTMEIPEAAGFTASVNSTIGLDTTANIVHFWTNNADSLNIVSTATDTTTTHVLHATAVAGIGAFSAIATGDLPTGIPIGNIGSSGLSGTAPVAISAGGAISITGAAGQVLAGAGPAFTATPSLGTDGSVAGTLQLANSAAAFHTILSSAATANNTVSFFATAPTTGDLVSCTTASTTCTLTDSAVLAANVVTAASNFANGAVVQAAGANKTLASATGHGIALPLDCAAASGSGTAYTCTTSPTFTPADGDAILFEADLANTGAATLNVNSSSAAPIKKQGGGTALVANDILAGQDVFLIYDGTNWQMQGQLGNAAGGGTPCTITALSLQYNNGGAFGCLAEFTYASSTITSSAAGKIDLSATTGASAFRTQVLAGAAPALNGAIAYDSTNNMFHGGLSSADSKFASFTATPAANNNCVKWVVSGSNFLLGDAGAACLGGISSVVSVTPTTVNTNTVSEQFMTELSLTAGYLNTLKQPFWFNAAGVYTTPAAQTPTLRFRIKICTISGCGSGTVVTLADIITTATTASVTNNNWNLNILGATAATGATGNLEAHGHLSADLGALTTTADSIFNDVNTAVSGNIDLTAALFVDFTITFSTNAAGANSTTQRIGAVMPQTNPTGAGAASTSMALGSGSGTAGQLACVTASNTMGNCTTLPPNNFLGVFLPGGTSYATTGIVSVVIDATQNVTFGDILCASTIAGKSHDNLTVACANGEWVGTVTTTASSVSTVTASLRLQ